MNVHISETRIKAQQLLERLASGQTQSNVIYGNNSIPYECIHAIHLHEILVSPVFVSYGIQERTLGQLLCNFRPLITAHTFSRFYDGLEEEESKMIFKTHGKLEVQDRVDHLQPIRLQPSDSQMRHYELSGGAGGLRQGMAKGGIGEHTAHEQGRSLQ